jgi:hypothetical protein
MSNSKLVFGRKNYIFLIAAVITTFSGFIVMGMETAEYGFGALGLTVGPLFIFAGIALGFVSIFIKNKEA